MAQFQRTLAGFDTLKASRWACTVYTIAGSSSTISTLTWLMIAHVHDASTSRLWWLERTAGGEDGHQDHATADFLPAARPHDVR
jgi:hypothetical protein